jgi:hypothetical protein
VLTSVTCCLSMIIRFTLILCLVFFFCFNLPFVIFFMLFQVLYLQIVSVCISVLTILHVIIFIEKLMYNILFHGNNIIWFFLLALMNIFFFFLSVTCIFIIFIIHKYIYNKIHRKIKLYLLLTPYFYGCIINTTLLITIFNNYINYLSNLKLPAEIKVFWHWSPDLSKCWNSFNMSKLSKLLKLKLMI